jgi:hypothetical protein
MKTFHYIACDSIKYVKEAEASAKSFRLNTTDTKFILYTDLNIKSSNFDEIIKIPNLIPGGLTSKDWCEGKNYFKTKIDILKNSPYELNVYSDGDIKPLVNVDQIFSLLEKFDLAVAHDSCRSSKWSDLLNIPLCYPDFNCGLIFYKKSSTMEFFNEWSKNFEKYPQPHDQPSFRKTAWDNPMKIATLPPEFNIRPKQFHYRQNPTIIHGRGENFLPEIKSYEKLHLI